MGEYLKKEFEPGMYQLMKDRGYDLIPYVNHFGETRTADGRNTATVPAIPAATLPCSIPSVLCRDPYAEALSPTGKSYL